MATLFHTPSTLEPEDGFISRDRLTRSHFTGLSIVPVSCDNDQDEGECPCEFEFEVYTWHKGCIINRQTFRIPENIDFSLGIIERVPERFQFLFGAWSNQLKAIKDNRGLCNMRVPVKDEVFMGVAHEKESMRHGDFYHIASGFIPEYSV